MDIKQCPFCNSDDVGILGYYTFCCIICHNCGAKGPESDSENEAWDKWQQRHLTTACTRQAGEAGRYIAKRNAR